MPPGAWVLFLVFVLAAAQSVVGLVAWRRSTAGESVFSTPEADATHLVMNAVMAAMVTPAYTPAAGSLARLLLAFTALGVAVALARHRPGARNPGPLSFRAYAVAAAYHVLMLGAMIYALSAMAPIAGPMCWARMGGAMAPIGRAPQRVFSPTRALGALFALDALTGVIAVLALPRQLLAAEAPHTETPLASGVPPDRRRVRQLRVGFIPHLVMDAGMVWMLSSL